MTNIFMTFCFDIERIRRDILIKAAIALYRSLVYFKNNFELHIYTNIDELTKYFENDTNIKIINHNKSRLANNNNC